MPKDQMLKWSAYGHLPQSLHDISQPFSDLAQEIVYQYEPSAERDVSLRKLLEAKDAAVREKL